MATTVSITTTERTPEPAVGVLEEVVCDACGSEASTPVLQRPDALRVVECERCGLMYLSPRPKANAIESWYCGDYFSGDAARVGRGYADYLAQDALADLRLIARQKLVIVSRHIRLKGETVLELGCATGETCYAASQEGARIVGCDLSLDAIQVAQRRYPGLDFQVASTEHLPFATASFDAVLAFELIEHVSSPSAFVREVYRVLRPGGMLVLTTPNVECGRTVGWNQWTGFLTSFEHLYFFDSKTLGRAVSRTGMSIVGIYSQGEGRITKPKAAMFKSVLRRLRLFGPMKAMYRAVLGLPEGQWLSSDALHTLMMVARKT